MICNVTKSFFRSAGWWLIIVCVFMTCECELALNITEVNDTDCFSCNSLDYYPF